MNSLLNQLFENLESHGIQDVREAWKTNTIQAWTVLMCERLDLPLMAILDNSEVKTLKNLNSYVSQLPPEFKSDPIPDAPLMWRRPRQETSWTRGHLTSQLLNKLSALSSDIDHLMKDFDTLSEDCSTVTEDLTSTLIPTSKKASNS